MQSQVAARLYGNNNPQCDTGALDCAPLSARIYLLFLAELSLCCCAGFSLVAGSEDHSLGVEHRLKDKPVVAP